MNFLKIFENRDIHIILCQLRRKTGFFELWDFISELRETDCSTNKEIVDFFKKSGLYNSELLRYKYSKKGLYVPEFNQEHLAQFSHAVDLDEILISSNPEE